MGEIMNHENHHQFYFNFDLPNITNFAKMWKESWIVQFWRLCLCIWKSGTRRCGLTWKIFHIKREREREDQEYMPTSNYNSLKTFHQAVRQQQYPSLSFLFKPQETISQNCIWWYFQLCIHSLASRASIFSWIILLCSSMRVNQVYKEHYTISH